LTDNGLPERKSLQAEAQPAARSDASCATNAQLGKGPRRGWRGGRESRDCLCKSLPVFIASFIARRLAALEHDSVTSGFAFLYRGAGWSYRSARKAQKVAKLKKGGKRETFSSLLPSSPANRNRCHPGI